MWNKKENSFVIFVREITKLVLLSLTVIQKNWGEEKLINLGWEKTPPKYLSDFKCGVEAQEVDQSWYGFSCKEAPEAESDEGKK